MSGPAEMRAVSRNYREEDRESESEPASHGFGNVRRHWPMTDNSRYLSAVGQAFRALPVAFRGKARIARLALGRHMQARDLRVVTRDGFRVTVPCVADSIGFHLFTDGVYEPAELTWMSSQLAEGDVYVDVGANIGAFVLPLARVVGARGRVLLVARPGPRGSTRRGGNGASPTPPRPP